MLQIPLGKTSPMWIETGLAYRNSYVLYVSDDYSFKPKEADSDFLNKLDGYQGNYLELPVKAMYKLTLWRKKRGGEERRLAVAECFALPRHYLVPPARRGWRDR